ncbi:hypothetical protein INR49_008076 [Caranx melampygus]|nr:hypothetical protein INR49_008076 [Caranx melampygus]
MTSPDDLTEFYTQSDSCEDSSQIIRTRKRACCRCRGIDVSRCVLPVDMGLVYSERETNYTVSVTGETGETGVRHAQVETSVNLSAYMSLSRVTCQQHYTRSAGTGIGVRSPAPSSSLAVNIWSPSTWSESRSQPTCQSAYDGDVHQLYRLLSDHPDKLNVQDERTGDTPLIAACRRGNLRTVKYLLANGADVHLTNKKQRTCLHYVSKRSFSLLDYLLISVLMPILLLGYFLMLQKKRQLCSLMEVVLGSNVSVNAVDYKGNSALHYVCLRKNHGLVPLLLDRDANVNIRNNDGELPLDIATRLKFKKIVHMLKKTQ